MVNDILISWFTVQAKKKGKYEALLSDNIMQY